MRKTKDESAAPERTGGDTTTIRKARAICVDGPGFLDVRCQRISIRREVGSGAGSDFGKSNFKTPFS